MPGSRPACSSTGADGDVTGEPFLLHEYLDRTARRLPRKTALVCEGRRWSYGEIDAQSSSLARSLIDRGLRRQDRVVIFLDNCAEAVIALYGVMKAGGTFVLPGATMKAPKLGYIVEDCAASFLISHREKQTVVGQALARVGRPVSSVWVGGVPAEAVFGGHDPGLAWEPMIAFPGADGAAARPQRQCGVEGVDVDLAALIYTSGSTAEPKGVMCTHRNMVTVARSIVGYLENCEDDVVLSVLPLSFDYGLYQVLMAFMFGGTVVLENSFLYPVRIYERIGEEGVTGFPLVPFIAASILNLQDFSRFDFRSLRYMTNTAAVLPEDHVLRLRRLFPAVSLYKMYGLTECKRVSYLAPEEVDRRPGSVGRPIPNCEAFVVDGSGQELPAGEVGELVVRGGNVMQGYWNAPELTAAIFRPGRYASERYLHTGDLFRRDEEGFLYYVGRIDDMIKTKGERVSPREIENTLQGLAEVAEAAVYGVPDETIGQAVVASVVLREGMTLTERLVLKHCSELLEPFMVPRSVEFLSEFPRTPNGKVDKRLLLDRHGTAAALGSR